MTEFTQLYLTPKIFLMGNSLAFSLKEDPVRCAKVCDKSWVILRYTIGGIDSKEKKKKGNKAREREDCRGQFSMALSSVGSLRRRAW